MTGCEIRKLFQQTSTRIILVVLFAANAFLVWNQQLPGTQRHDNIHAKHILSLYKALPENADQALAALEQQDELLTDAVFEETDTGTLLTTDIYTEHQLFSSLIERVEPIAHYKSILREIDENAQAMLMKGRFEPNSFAYRNVLKSQEKFRLLSNVQPAVLYSGAVEMMPGGRITDIMLVLLCLLVGLELLSAERIRGTLALAKPTFRGGAPFLFRKILVGLLAVFVGTCLLYGTNLLIGVIRCGAISLRAPIQSVFGFVRSHWNISIGAYIAGFLIMKFLWGVSIIAIVYVACCLGRSVMECCGVFLLMGAPSIVRKTSALSLLTTGNTVKLFSEYRNLDILGWPVSSFAVSISGMLVVSIAGFGLAMLLYIKLPPTVYSRQRRKARTSYRVCTNLFLHEARKLLVLNGGIWVLIGLVAVQIVTYHNFESFIPPQERLYIHYSEILSGEANCEKEAFLAEETARFAELYTQMDEYAVALSAGQMRQEAYDTACLGIMRQLEGETAFRRAENQYEQMKALGCDYVCLTGYERLLGAKGQHDAIVLSIKLIVSLILGLSSIHAVENESNMVLLLNSVPRNRDSRRRKGILISVYALIAALISFVPQILAISEAYGLPSLGADANSVPMLKLSMPTVLGSLFFYAMCIIALAIFLSHVVTYISKKTGNTSGTIVITSFLLLPSACLLILY